MNFKCKILENKSISTEYFLMKIFSREIAENAKAGQFVSIKVSEGLDPLLRRPLSFFEIDRKKNIFSILYQVKGKGTKILAEKKAHEYLDVIGPLGNGFKIPGHFRKVAIVAGGIGVAPLVELAKYLNYQKREVYFLLGLRERTLYNFIKNTLDFLKPVNFLTAIEEDIPRHGRTVIVLFENFLKNKKIDCIAACGPGPMLGKLKNITIAKRIPAYVSFEEHMACSIGVCKGCAIPSQDRNKYKLVCKDGPIFDLRDIILC